MSTVFTQHAVERIQKRSENEKDLSRLISTLERVGNNPTELTSSGEVVRLGQQWDEPAFIVRAGDMRAIVTFDPDKPEELIVMSVYRADEKGDVSF